ncbi:hypothetical protein LCGC14_1111210 [marine sediment metagenome]|uniref:KTSC domain-containing protein n=1 Tax=marine sediment metagenome TaxID=412755 RepID=A0A0F9MBG3_9ZZZZ
MTIEWTDVDSSNLAAIGYDEEDNSLFVRFNSGQEYVYYDVPVDIFEAFKDAESKGKYLNEHIKGAYGYAKR